MKNISIKILLGLCFLLILSCNILAQSKKVTGLVTDDSRMPIPGATVLVKETTIGTTTNLDGEFEITVPNENGILIFSFIGMQSKEVELNGQSNLQITLESDFVGIEEIVVVGYGQLKSADLTGAVASINSDELSRSRAADLGEAMQGLASGVHVTQNSGAPGEGVAIKIRGTGTLNNAEPLYVVDGFVVDDINYLAPGDIKDIQILKDAASAAVYGSRAANGVIMVTTKQGKDGEVKINAGTSFSWQDYWQKPDLMKQEEYLFWVNTMNPRKEVDSMYNGIIPIPAIPNEPHDWLNEVSQQGFIQKYNFSISGGSNKVTYYLSSSYHDNKGLIKNSRYKKNNLVGNFTYNFSKKLTLKSYITYSNANKDRVPSYIYKEALITPPNLGTWVVDDIKADTLHPRDNNPVFKLNDISDKEKTSYTEIKGDLEYKAFKGFKFTSRIGFSNNHKTRQWYDNVGQAYDYSYSYDLRENSNGTAKDNIIGTLDQRYNSYANTIKYQWENFINYNNKFGLHDFALTLASTFERKRQENFDAWGRGTGGHAEYSQHLNSVYLGKNVGGGAYQWSSVGFVGRINYNYADRYLVQMNMRADGSSKFYEGNRWGYFPSLSAGWRISNENFWSSPQWLTLLKLRVGYGQLGNNRIGNYDTYTQVTNGKYYVYGQGNGITKLDGYAPNGISNRYIKWETVTTYNAGIDAAFFNKLVAHADYFRKITSDMLVDIPLVSSTGINANNSPARNAGELLNQGIEFSLNYTESIGKFKFDIGANVTRLYNKVLSLGERDEPILGGKEAGNYRTKTSFSDYYLTKTEVGKPISEFYGYVLEGQIKTVSDFAKFNVNPESYNFGDYVFKDINGDGIRDDKDRTSLGSPNPDWLFGFNVSASYGILDFSMNWIGQTGNKIFNKMNYYLKSAVKHQGNASNSYTGYYKYFYDVTSYDPVPDIEQYNPNHYATLPTALPSLTKNDNYLPSTFYIEDGDYLRLKDIQIGVNINGSTFGFIEKIGIHNLRFYAGAQNLLTFTKYTGLDPEIGNARTSGSGPGTVNTKPNLSLGIDDANYPQARSYFFGLNITL